MKSKFLWLPLGDENLASSRLRCFVLNRELNKMGISSKIGLFGFASIYVIQKRLDFKALFFVFMARLIGGKIILDIDDVLLNNIDWKNRVRYFAKVVDAITTATEEQMKIVKNCLYTKDLENISYFVFENPIDYYNESISPTSVISNDGNLRVGWFGNSANFNLYNEFEEISNMGYSIVIISDENPYSNIDNKININFVKWNKSTFELDLMNNVDVCILSHFGGTLVNSKSANKLVASIYLGVPVIASSTPAYSRMLNLLSKSDYLYSSTSELVYKLSKLSDSNERKKYLEIRNTVEFAGFFPNNVANNFCEFSNNLKFNNAFNWISIVNIFSYLGSSKFKKII